MSQPLRASGHVDGTADRLTDTATPVTIVKTLRVNLLVPTVAGDNDA
jgi:hypothetical protein